MAKQDLSIGRDFLGKQVLFIAEKHILKGGELDYSARMTANNYEWQPFRVISNNGQETRSCGFVSSGAIDKWS
jgi:hypothetical protein